MADTAEQIDEKVEAALNFIDLFVSPEALEQNANYSPIDYGIVITHPKFGRFHVKATGPF